MRRLGVELYVFDLQRDSSVFSALNNMGMTESIKSVDAWPEEAMFRDDSWHAEVQSCSSVRFLIVRRASK